MQSNFLRLGTLRKVAGATALSLSVGCQSYHQKPLNVAEHEKRWRARDPVSPEVLSVAAQINATRLTPINIDSSDGLAIEEAEILALVFNPDLRQARSEAQIVQATAGFSGRWPDPVVNINALNIVESVPAPWVIGSSLALTIPISGRLAVEKNRAETQALAELARVAESEWTALRALRNQWYQWSASFRRVELLESYLEELSQVESMVDRLLDIGELLRPNARLFTMEQQSRLAELDFAKGERDANEQRLRILLGMRSEHELKLLPNTFEAIFPLHVSGDISDSNLTLARLRLEYAVAEHTLRREVREQYPDLTLGPQHEQDEGQSRVGFIGSIPLPIFNANRGAIAGARARRDAARIAFETTYERLTGRLEAAQTQSKAAFANQTRLGEFVIPLANKITRDARVLTELGELGSLTLLESLTRRYATQLESIGAALDTATATNEIRFLIGPEQETQTSD